MFWVDWQQRSECLLNLEDEESSWALLSIICHPIFPSSFLRTPPEYPKSALVTWLRLVQIGFLHPSQLGVCGVFRDRIWITLTFKLADNVRVLSYIISYSSSIEEVGCKALRMTMGVTSNPSWCQDCQDAEETLSTELRNFLLCAKSNTKPSILMLPSYKRQVTSSDGRFDFHWLQTVCIQSYFLLLEMVIRFVHWVFLWEQSANPKNT